MRTEVTLINVAFAHTLPGLPSDQWEPLTKHLSEVGSLAATHAAAFGSSAWGAALGRCHDLGKGSAEFQEYLRRSSEREAQDAGVENGRLGRVDHSTFGARFVAENAGKLQGELLAYCIAGHHGGLPNAVSGDDATQFATLCHRLEAKTIPKVEPPFPVLEKLTLPWAGPSSDDIPFSMAFFTRMLFSCLVDADRTCTESFCSPETAEERARPRPSITDLQTVFKAYLDSRFSGATASAVNVVRHQVLEQCRSSADLDCGFFTLQVPTGGGKTLSSLAFALDHAERHGLRRVVVAIPFTSIIEQTADLYRDALGPLAQTGLVEHHTSLQPERETRSNQLGSENWDAPLIVTTNVQLLESLFASRTTPCRKLHRLASSVIILDEAQTLPVELLAPTLQALRELVARYGCTVVLCTATQPALERREGFPFGLDRVRPIIAEPSRLFDALRRVEVLHEGKLTDGELVSRLAAEESVLTIVNTRPHAAKLFAELRERCDPGSAFHLSTLMCGAHRRAVLKQIRERVGRQPCRVVSTQLIEAGVDVDFPVVYRAEAGFDSLAQAAGRCNREGLLPGLGAVHLFEAEKRPPPGYLADTAQVARELLGLDPDLDPLAPSSIEAYFRQYYWKSEDVLDKFRVLDKTTIDRLRGHTVFQFREIEEAYQIIRDTQVPVLIPYSDPAKRLVDSLLNSRVPFVSQSKLQPFLVSIPERAANTMATSGAVQKHESGVFLLLRDDAYDSAQGLRLSEMELDARAWSV